LFLDEIGDMSLALQTRLLRVLAESEFFRVGGQTAIRVDVRVIAATHQDLAQAVSVSRFREDLYHRLNVMRIEVPPLRQRREDIRELTRFYLEQAANELGVAPKTLSPDAAEVLLKYDWPGNVRELVNVCRRLTVTAAGREIGGQDLPHELGGSATQATADWTMGLAQWAEGQLAVTAAPPLLDEALPAFERTLIVTALRRARGKRLEAAKLLGWAATRSRARSKSSASRVGSRHWPSAGGALLDLGNDPLRELERRVAVLARDFARFVRRRSRRRTSASPRAARRPFPGSSSRTSEPPWPSLGLPVRVLAAPRRRRSRSTTYWFGWNTRHMRCALVEARDAVTFAIALFANSIRAFAMSKHRPSAPGCRRRRRSRASAPTSDRITSRSWIMKSSTTLTSAPRPLNCASRWHSMKRTP
jgi:hypothetical protein